MEDKVVVYNPLGVHVSLFPIIENKNQAFPIDDSHSLLTVLTGFLSNYWIHGDIIWTLQESKSNWLTIKRALQLVVDDTDTAKYFSS